MSRRVNKKALAVFVVLVIVSGGIAWIAYRRSKRAEASGSQPTDTASSTTSYLPSAPSSSGSTSSSTGTYTPPAPPTAPADPYKGKTLIALQDGVKVYNSDFTTVYKTVSKGGWIGVVDDSTGNNWYKITTTSPGARYVLKTQAKVV